MNQRYDLLAISLLFLSVILTIWLGVLGPQGVILKDWQPLLASIIALGGGALAYQAAMAKVNYDRATRDRDERRKKLGVYLRAEYTCLQLSDRASSLCEKTNVRRAARRTIELDELRMVADLYDLTELWAHLELFPMMAAFRMSQIKSCITTLKHFVEGQPSDASWEIGSDIPYSSQMKVTYDLAKDLRSACEDVLREIQPMISHMTQAEHGL